MFLRLQNLLSRVCVCFVSSFVSLLVCIVSLWIVCSTSLAYLPVCLNCPSVCRYLMTTAALGLIGVTEADTVALFRALAGVLYLGQVGMFLCAGCGS